MLFQRLKTKIRDLLVTPPPLGSGTLNYDDVIIAKKQLRNRGLWTDESTEKRYARDLAQWNGSKYAFAFLGGRVALSACIYALNIKPGDEVILPGYTCVVVPNAFHFAGVKTVYSDIELDTYGLDASLIKKKITARTKAIVLHHLFGLVCRDYETILEIGREHNIPIIEDCAHAAGALFKNKKVGNYGDLAFYSTEQSKIFNTIQGGFVTTNSDLLKQRLEDFYNQAPYPNSQRIEKQLYNVGMHYYKYKHPLRKWTGKIEDALHRDKIYDSTTEEEIKGIKPKDYGCKLPAALAMIGLNQLRKVDLYNEIRRKNAKRWAQWCEINNYQKPLIISHSIPVFLRYPVLVEPEKKSKPQWAYNELGITLGRWFISPIHPSRERRVEGCPNAEEAVRRCINFPTIFN
jgi:perosamine synthetase